MADNRDIIVRIKSDASDMLKGYQKAIDELEKYSNKAKPFNEMQSDIDELKNGIDDLKKELSSVGSEKIDSSQIDKLLQKLSSQEEKIKRLQKNQKKIKIDVDESSGKKLDQVLSKAEESLKSINESLKPLKELGLSIDINEKSIKNTENKIQNIKNKIEDLIKQLKFLEGNGDVDNFENLSEEESINAIILKLKEYEKIKNELQGKSIVGNTDNKELNNLRLNLGILAKEIDQLQLNIKNDPVLDIIDINDLTKQIDIAEKVVNIRIRNLQEEINKLQNNNAKVDVTNFTLKDGKISIPLQVGTTINQLSGQIKQVLSEVQSKVWTDNITVSIPLTFTSSYKGKINEEIKEINNIIEGIGDIDLKNKLILQVENLTKQLTNRDLRLEFKTNIKDINEDVNSNLKSIKSALKEAKLYIYPEVSIDEKSQLDIQKTLDKISKSLKIDLGIKDFDINKFLNEEELKKIQESFKSLDIKISPTVNLTDKDIEKITKNINTQLNKLHIEIDTSKLQEGIKTALDNTIIDNWKNRFISAIDIVVSKIEKSFGMLSKNSFYEAMKGWSNADSIMRENRTGTKSHGGKFDTTKEITAYGELERIALVNTKTNEIFGNYIVDQAHSVSGKIQEALKILASDINGDASDFYDTIIHSHPAGYRKIKGEIYKGKGSNIGFSDQDLVSYQNALKEGFKKIMVESNGMINELDFSSLSKNIVDQIVSEYKKALKTNYYKDQGYNPRDLYDTSNKTVDYDIHSEVLNKTLSSILSSKGLDPSKYLKQYSIDSLKLNVDDFEKDQQEINNLIKLLSEMSSTLSEINKKDIKFDTTSINTITEQINILIRTITELKELFTSFNTNNTFNISVEPINNIIAAIDKMTISIQKAFGMSTDADIANQWSIIESKFRSIADESDKIDLRKQKNEIKELVTEYQKYLDMGGQNTFENLTNNSKTIEKLQNQYDKLNTENIKDVDNRDLQKLKLNVDIDETEIIRQVNEIIDAINSNGNRVKNIKIEPDTSSDNWSNLNIFIQNLNSIDDTKINSFHKALDNIKIVLNEINGLNNIHNIFESINIKKTQISNLSELPSVLTNISQALNNIVLTSDGNNLLSQINDIVKNADSLKDLASVLKSSKSKIKEVSNTVGASNTTNELNELKKQNDIIVNIGDTSETTSSKIINSENQKQKEYKESTDALIALRDAQTGTVEAYNKANNYGSFNGSKNPHEQAKRFFEEYAKSISNSPGFSEAQYSINTDSQGNFKDATIKYYNDNLKQTITETWKWHEANKQIVDDMDRMVVTNINYKDAISERDKAEERSSSYLNKQYEKIKDIQSVYDSSINPNTKKGIKNQEDLEILRQKTQEIVDIIKNNIGKNITQEFKDNLYSMINDLERTRKSFTDKEYGSTELSPKELKINKDIVGDQYDELIAKTQAAGTYASELSQKILETRKSIDAVGDSTGLKTLSDQLKSYKTEFSKLKSEDKFYKNNINVIQDYERESSKLIELQSKQDFGNGEWQEQIKAQIVAVESLKEKAKEAFSEIEKLYNNNKISKYDFDSVSEFYDNAGKGSIQAQAKYFDKQVEYQKKIQEEIKITQSELIKLSNIDGTDIFKNSLSSLVSNIEILNNKLQTGEITIKDYKSEIQQLFNSINTKNTIKIIEPGNISAGILELKNLMNVLSKGKAEIKTLDEQNAKLTFSFEEQKGKIRTLTLGYNQLTGNIDILKNELKEVPTGLDKLYSSLVKKWKDVISYLASFGSLYTVWAQIRQGVTYIKELDTALTEMRKVSNETVQSLKEFQKASFDIGDNVGATSAVIQNSTADWMRLGESIDEAVESAKTSNILLNVSEFEDISSATDALVSASQAYKDLEKIDIVDKMNNIGNNYSIATDGIATALQDSASALTTAGNDLDEAIALITAGNAVVQDPNSVGSGLRTIALRLTGTTEAKEQLEELGEETDNVVTTTSKLRDTIMSATKVESNAFKGFDILDENGNYKSTYEILQGIADVYEEIVETDKKSGSNNVNLLLETLAGKNRANIAASILQNPEMLRNVFEDSQNSAGSAEEELSKYLDSIEGKINRLTNRIQEFWYTAIDSDTVKSIVDVLTQIVQFGTTIVDTFGSGSLAVTGLLAAFSKFSGLKIFSGGRAKNCSIKKVNYPPRFN